jgi:UDP-3-O-[3-hydroxymyristoyl] glucosamine N-acyltransferase
MKEARYTLAELAERYRLRLDGDGSHAVSRVATLSEAGPDAVTFLSNPAYRDELMQTRAGAVILREQDAVNNPRNSLIAEDPYLAYARVASLFDHRPVAEPGIHASATVDASARLGEGVHVGAGAVIGPGCEIGDGCSIGPGCVLMEGCRVGAGSRLAANVTLCDGVTLGRRVLVHPGAVIGADGFGIARAPEGWVKVPQLGAVLVGDDCEIGANSCIDRGAIGDTVLEEDVRIDNLCQIGHNCHVGAHTAMAAMTGLAGSSRIGRNCLLGGRSGVFGHLEIADNVTIGAATAVNRSITEAGTTWSGHIPAQPIREWQRIVAHMKRLDRTIREFRTGTTKRENNDE